MAVSVRTRFEVFKRDDFRCRYCGRRSPEVVLEVDHIVPVVEGGLDDVINLATSCWDCNHGRSGKPLADILTGEDPHTRAIELLEQERQLQEYHYVLTQERTRREDTAWSLVRHWKSEQGYFDEDELGRIAATDYQWLLGALQWCPEDVIRRYMHAALLRGMTKNLKYVAVCCRNWKYEQAADLDTNQQPPDKVEPAPTSCESGGGLSFPVSVTFRWLRRDGTVERIAEYTDLPVADRQRLRALLDAIEQGLQALESEARGIHDRR